MGLALKGVVLRLGPGGEILGGMGIGGRGGGPPHCDHISTMIRW